MWWGGKRGACRRPLAPARRPLGLSLPMTAPTSFALDQRRALVADLYEERGYRVAIDPDPGSLPGGLRGKALDLIAWSDHEAVAVVLEPPGGFKVQTLRALETAVATLPDWRLERHFLEGDAPVARDIPAAATARRWLTAGRAALQGSEPGLGALGIWSAFECAVRMLAADTSDPGGTVDLQTSAAIRLLQGRMPVGPDGRSAIVRAKRTRDALAHGSLLVPIEDDAFLTVADLTERALERL